MNHVRTPLLVGSLLTVVLAATACGGSDAADTATAGAADTGTAAQGGTPTAAASGAAGAPRGGASGLVAAVSGTTAQVQSAQSGQVAVSWSAETAFTRQVTGSRADVTVGSCVFVMPATDASTSSDSATVAAGTVRVTDAVDGACTGGFGGSGAGGFPGGAPSGMPTDRPSGAPDGRGGGPGGMGFGANGQVTAVTADGFTVASSMPTQDATTEVAVTVDAATTYTTTAAATADAVQAGVCVSADGQPDQTGAVTATRISVSDAVDGACTMGGGIGGFAGQPGGTATS